MAEIISNYTTLVSALVNSSEDDSEEFRSFIPTAVGLAEDRLARELDSQLFIVNTSVSVDSGSRFIDKPSGYRVGQHITWKTSTGNRKVLRKRTPSFCETYWPYEASTAEPQYYADYDVSTLLVAPTPDINSYVMIQHEAKPTYLSSAASVNDFSVFYPNVLYYATMCEVTKFRKAWTQLPIWEEKYVAARDAANNEGRRARRDGTEPLTNPEPVNNTLMGGN